MPRRILLALLLCAACKHSTSSSSTSHTETQTVTDTQTSESGAVTTTTTVTEAPGETTTTISEYDPPSKEEPGSPDESEARPDGVRHQPPGEAGLPPTVPRRGPLRKQTVIEDKHGATTAKTAQEATSQAQGATETRATGKVDATAKATSESKPAASCIGASWLWGAAVLIGIGGVLYFAIKMRKTV